MRSVEELIEEVKHLSHQDRSRLVEAIGTLEHNGDEHGEPSQADALDLFLTLAGTAEAVDTDVASDKYKHLAQIYSDTHEDV